MEQARGWIEYHDRYDYAVEIRCTLGKLVRLIEKGKLHPELLKDFEAEVISAWLQHSSVFEFLNASETLNKISKQVDATHSCTLSGKK